MSGIQTDMQFASFVTLLAQHGGHFPSAYASLVETYDDDVVTERTATKWLKRLDREMVGAEIYREVQRYLQTGQASLATLDRPLSQPEVKQALGMLEAGSLRVLNAVLNDDGCDVYSEGTRARVALKVLELSGTAERARGKASEAQHAHQQMTRIGGTFGIISDRAVLAAYVQCGERTDRLVEWLRAVDPSMAEISAETTAGHLAYWQRHGVVMAADGAVEDWDDALQVLRTSLRIVLEPHAPEAQEEP